MLIPERVMTACGNRPMSREEGRSNRTDSIAARRKSMGYTPESADDSIYTLRRRISTRPTDEQETALDQQTGVPKPRQRGSAALTTRFGSLIVRLFPSVRLGH